MARQSTAERERARDEAQVRRHYMHWGVKAVISLAAAATLGLLWLAWLGISGSYR